MRNKNDPSKYLPAQLWMPSLESLKQGWLSSDRRLCYEILVTKRYGVARECPWHPGTRLILTRRGTGGNYGLRCEMWAGRHYLSLTEGTIFYYCNTKMLPLVFKLLFIQFGTGQKEVLNYKKIMDILGNETAPATIRLYRKRLRGIAQGKYSLPYRGR